MDYVMVPVPEDHVVDVMQYITRLVARASVVPWTKEALEEVFEEVDEPSRALMSLVARTIVQGKDLSDEEGADALELTVRDLRSIVRDINEVALRGKFAPVLTTREASVLLRNGRTVQRRLFTMDEGVARMIREHERKSLPVTDQATNGEA